MQYSKILSYFIVQVAFNITDGNTDDAFAINSSGVVTTTKKLDRETKSSYLLTVRYELYQVLVLKSYVLAIYEPNKFNQSPCEFKHFLSDIHIRTILILVYHYCTSLCFLKFFWLNTRSPTRNLFQFKPNRVQMKGCCCVDCYGRRCCCCCCSCSFGGCCCCCSDQRTDVAIEDVFTSQICFYFINAINSHSFMLQECFVKLV